MISKLYSIRDRKAEFYGTPFASVSDVTAQRDFFAYCKMPNNAYISGDLELYYVGEIESLNGIVTLPDNGLPRFICNYSEVLDGE